MEPLIGWFSIGFSALSLLACGLMARSQRQLLSTELAKDLRKQWQRAEAKAETVRDEQDAAFAHLRREFAQLNEDVSDLYEKAATRLQRARVAQNAADKKAAKAEAASAAADSVPAQPALSPDQQWELEQRRRIAQAAGL